MIVYGALARASALIDGRKDWWVAEAYDVDSKLIVKTNPVYQDRYKDQDYVDPNDSQL